jgi:hypothetical protein
MGVGRRALLQGLAAAAAVPSYVEAIAQPSVQAVTARRRILIKGGYVASLDKSIGDLPVGDVLTDGATIAAIGKDLDGKTGKRADIIVADLDDITLIPSTDPIATFVLRAQPANISHVLVDGNVKKRDGKLVGVDQARVRRLAKESHGYFMGLISSAGLDIRKG